MNKMYELFYRKEDEYFGNDNVKWEYKRIFNTLKNLIEQISKNKERYSKFEVNNSVEDIIENCKTYFLEKYQSFS